MASGTAPNTSVVLTAEEISFIERRYKGSKSQAIHQGLSAIMPVKSDANFTVSPHVDQFIKPLRLLAQHRYDLDYMQQAIEALRVEYMVEELRIRGLAARCKFSVPMCGEETYQTNYVLVYSPDGVDLPNEWATVEECQRLIDTAANLPLAEAFLRWRERIEPWNVAVYTDADAQRDMRAERAVLRQQYDNGQLDGEMFRITYGQASEFLNYAMPKQPGETVTIEE